MERIKVRIYNMLKWSEKYTKTDMIYLARGGFWVTLSSIVSALSAFALAIAYANLLPKESYGTYKYILSFTGIIAAFSLTGIPIALIPSISRGFEGSFKYAVRISAKWSSGIFVISLISAIYYFINDNFILGSSLIIAGVMLPIINVFGIYGSYLQGKKDFRRSTIYTIFKTAFIAVAIVGTIFITDKPLYIILSYFLITAIVTLFLFFLTNKVYKQNDKIDTKFVSFGKHLSLLNIFGLIAGNLDKILIFHFLGAAQLAVYTFAIAIPNQIGGFNKGIKGLVLPKISEGNIDGLKKSIPTKSLKLLMIFTVMSILYIITAPYIYKTFFPQYVESIIYSQVLSIIFIFSAGMLLSQTFIAHGGKKDIYKIRLITDITKIILLLILLPFYGIWGAIISIFVSKSVSIITMYILFRKL